MAETNPALGPDLDAPEGGAGIQLAQFGAGCFWSVELIFQRLEGVVKTEVGYSQGNLDNPTYKDVCTDKTGHSEVVRLHFDPTVCSYSTLLGVFWSKRDHTILNRQGDEAGTQYRSGIYYYSEEQAKIAREFLEEMQKELPAKIVVEILPAKKFYPAEEYHQQYLEKGGQCASKGCKDPIRCYG